MHGMSSEQQVAAETTAFRGDDPGCLVEAGLACRLCLSGDVDWSLALEPWDHHVSCRCRRCGHERRVSLTGEQALRLSLHAGGTLDGSPTPHSGLALIG